MQVCREAPRVSGDGSDLFEDIRGADNRSLPQWGWVVRARARSAMRQYDVPAEAGLVCDRRPGEDEGRPPRLGGGAPVPNCEAHIVPQRFPARAGMARSETRRCPT